MHCKLILKNFKLRGVFLMNKTFSNVAVNLAGSALKHSYYVVW